MDVADGAAASGAHRKSTAPSVVASLAVCAALLCAALLAPRCDRSLRWLDMSSPRMRCSVSGRRSDKAAARVNGGQPSAEKKWPVGCSSTGCLVFFLLFVFCFVFLLLFFCLLLFSEQVAYQMKQGVNDKVCSGMIALVKVQATKTVRKKKKTAALLAHAESHGAFRFAESVLSHGELMDFFGCTLNFVFFPCCPPSRCSSTSALARRLR